MTVWLGGNSPLCESKPFNEVERPVATMRVLCSSRAASNRGNNRRRRRHGAFKRSNEGSRGDKGHGRPTHGGNSNSFKIAKPQSPLRLCEYKQYTAAARHVAK